MIANDRKWRTPPLARARQDDAWPWRRARAVVELHSSGEELILRARRAPDRFTNEQFRPVELQESQVIIQLSDAAAGDWFAAL